MYELVLALSANNIYRLQVSAMLNLYKTISGSGAHESCQPLTPLDLIMSPGSYRCMLVYEQHLDEGKLLESLVRILDIYPIFSGRIQDFFGDFPSISLRNGGVLFVSEAHACDLKHSDNERNMNFYKFDFCTQINASNFDETTPIFQVKYSTFKNCSVLGFAVSHAFCDAASLWNFLVAWSRHARGFDFEPLACDRHVLCRKGKHFFPARKPPDAMPAQEGALFESRVFHLSSVFINELRSSDYLEDEFFSDQDLIMAYIWRLIALGADLNEEALFPLTLVYNMRKRLNLNSTYIGNAVLMKRIEEDRRKIIDSSATYMAKKIRAFSEEITEETIWSDVGYLLSARRQPAGAIDERIGSIQQGLVVNNWTKFPIYEIDFGAGSPAWFDMPGLSQNNMPWRYVLITKPPQGGVNCYASLPAEELKKLREKLNSSATPAKVDDLDCG